MKRSVFFFVGILGCATLSAAEPANVPMTTVVAAAQNRFTPAVKEAYLIQAKKTVMASLKESGREVPEDFLAWVDSDPVVRATVYGARANAANVLVMLRSLELDLGSQAVRKDYTQLALSMAVVRAADAATANLEQRSPLKVVIPGDPRVPVDTKDPNRKLDSNDHIVNFLNDHTITEDVVVGQKEQDAPLKYNDKGIAIPPKAKAAKVKVPIIEKRTRSLYAADVIASRALQIQFNDYMKSKGHEVNIDCGDQVVTWKSKAAVRVERKKINEAFLLLRTAYEVKGLLPAARDAFPTAGESAAYYIRNDKYVFSKEESARRKWPLYPLNAPWPSLTLLAADNQPLREREERWMAYRDRGEMRTYGEYIGAIAQQFDMQSSRRVTPYPFAYNTYQMMAKDGGVCGTMANMGVRTYNTLGVPACTAGQPGHCALIYFSYDDKSKTYECKGGQFATGGADKTSPHTPWVFGDTDARRGMLYYLSIGWSINYGLQEYLDSTIAYQIYRTFSTEQQNAIGSEFLLSALAQNPYNILLTDALIRDAQNPQELVGDCKKMEALVAAVARPGCPKDGYYLSNIRAQTFQRLAKMDPPADPKQVLEIVAWLPSDAVEPMIHYRIAAEGIEAVKRGTFALYEKHLTSSMARTEVEAAQMAATLNAVANHMTDAKQRKQWASTCFALTAGREAFSGRKNKIIIDPAVVAAAKICRMKLPPENITQQPVLDAVTTELKSRISSNRNPKESANFAAKITALAGQIKSPEIRSTWLTELTTVITGHETFTVGKKTQRDVLADALPKLLAATVAP